METPDQNNISVRIDLNEIAKAFPERADSLLLDRYLVDRETASARSFRVYRETPPHFHKKCDEYLYVLSGRGTFWIGSAEHHGEFGPGTFMFFERGTVHALPTIVEQPVIFLSIDVPRREAGDIHFVHPEDGTPESFIQAAR